ncbi:hypothetical protein PTTG_10865, partial [Puccinia triticina 1-1 BBBD Race 1]|uniref:Uncharacterized protein n=1 Tax=Puccinia triticina (isolate 1-1 / race 1 (BBBD)) TaxID=630390 RepID=A0A0C4FCB3_PUCT1
VKLSVPSDSQSSSSTCTSQPNPESINHQYLLPTSNPNPYMSVSDSSSRPLPISLRDEVKLDSPTPILLQDEVKLDSLTPNPQQCSPIICSRSSFESADHQSSSSISDPVSNLSDPSRLPAEAPISSPLLQKEVKLSIENPLSPISAPDPIGQFHPTAMHASLTQSP